VLGPIHDLQVHVVGHAAGVFALQAVAEPNLVAERDGVADLDLRVHIEDAGGIVQRRVGDLDELEGLLAGVA